MLLIHFRNIDFVPLSWLQSLFTLDLVGGFVQVVELLQRGAGECVEQRHVEGSLVGEGGLEPLPGPRHQPQDVDVAQHVVVHVRSLKGDH